MAGHGPSVKHGESKGGGLYDGSAVTNAELELCRVPDQPRSLERE